MHYVIGDVHNDLRKLKNVLGQINIIDEDQLIFLGDLFDRGGADADPVGVYYEFLKFQGNSIWIKGNHDQWLADYIDGYLLMPERKRKHMRPYQYNSFDLIAERITEVDMMNLAERIRELPLQQEIVIDGTHYLLSHAMTSDPNVKKDDDYYLTGDANMDEFVKEGIDGYISIVGHTPVSYYDSKQNDIWYNDKKNVILMDCGCGFSGGRLACLCIGTGKVWYGVYENR